MAAIFVDLDDRRPVPSVERALSGPDSLEDPSWRRQVRVVVSGQGPGQRDQEALDRHRARIPLDGSRQIAVLGCTSGAGQSMVAMMTGRTLSAIRDVPVAALDLNPGRASLAARFEPATSVTALLAGRGPRRRPGANPGEGGHGPGPQKTADSGGVRPRSGRSRMPGRVDVIAAAKPGGGAAPALGMDDYRRLADLLAEQYPLTMIDPAPSGLTRVLALADQLVLVTPASPDAATALAHTQQWLSAHGYDELAARAVTVVNGVSRRSLDDALAAESVARGRCRAIVRLPWDDALADWPDSPAALQPQTRLAYTALSGVLVSGLATATPAAGSSAHPGTRVVRERGSLGAQPRTPAPGRRPGEHSD